MKKTIFALLIVIVLTSCGTTNSLYYWGGVENGTTTYESLAYKHYDKQTQESICQLISVYEDIVVKPSGQRKTPPPGICAEYGYMLLRPETAEIFLNKATSKQKRIFNRTDYDVFFLEKGKQLLEKEIELYPESKKFIEPLLEKL